MIRLNYKLIPTIKSIFFILFYLVLADGVIAQSYTKFIEKVQKYQENVKIKRTEQFPDMIDTSTFNTNKYLQLFDKLSLPTGLECRCIFIDEKTGGCPLLS